MKHAVLLIASLALICLLSACKDDVLKRPTGWIRIGSPTEFPYGETFLPDKHLVMKRDQNGFSVMSTECTFDLSPLKRVESSEGVLYVSLYTDSKYDGNGHVISPPSKANLPHYFIRFDASKYDGPNNALYVLIGAERPADWRLKIESLP